MLKKSSSEAGLFRPRVLAAFLLCSAGVCLAMFSFNGGVDSDRAAAVSSAPRYMPIPGSDPDDLDRMEAEWNNRLTYPTGIFDPAWVRQAAAVDKSILRSVPFGAGTLNLRVNALTGAQALDPSAPWHTRIGSFRFPQCVAVTPSPTPSPTASP